jgi:HEAT repeat protein
VRYSAAEALGSVFSQVPDKQQAWNDLLRLTSDKNSDVRTSSNHSLGRVSIFMASQAKTDDEYKKELEKAIEFFEIAAKEASYFNPAQFCLPFYLSFYTIIFKTQEAKKEVNKYLDEAKAAIEGSESKKQLFEAVQNLSDALKEVQNLGNLDFEAKKRELNLYRKYCDHAAELMKDTNEKAPFVTEVLRKGLLFLDRKLKSLLEEIQ